MEEAVKYNKDGRLWSQKINLNRLYDAHFLSYLYDDKFNATTGSLQNHYYTYVNVLFNSMPVSLL